MRKSIIFVLLFVFVLGFAFANGSSESAASDGKPTISMTWWGDTKRNEVYIQVIEEFEKANPEVVVEKPFATWANYFDKLSTQVAGGVAPDVIGMHQRYVSEYSQRGVLLDLQPFVDSGVLDLSDIPQSIIDAGKVNGVLYMIPQGLSGQAVSYYTKTFDDLGLEYPDMNWTWDEFVATLEEIQVAAKAQDKTKFWPCTDFSNDFYNFSFWVRSHGENLFTEDGQLGFSKETMISWFDFWSDLRDKGLIVDAATSAEYVGIPLEQSLLATGQVAISMMPISQVNLYEVLVDKGEYHLIRIPRIAGGLNPEYISGAFYTVNSKSKNPELAVSLINFFVNDPTAQSIFKQEQGMPPANKAVAILAETANRAEKESIDFIQKALIPNATPEPYPPAGYNEVNSNYVNFANAVAFGQMSSTQATDEFFAVCESILN